MGASDDSAWPVCYSEGIGCLRVALYGRRHHQTLVPGEPGLLAGTDGPCLPKSTVNVVWLTASTHV